MPRGGAFTLVRHQLGAMVATIVDFTMMITLVSVAGTTPEVGTAIGAASGGTVNFLLGRHWIFRSTADHPGLQAGRYALVSLGGLVLNTAGVHVLAGLQHVHYIAARIMVAIAVSLLWNYPMQRNIVFGASPK